MQRNDTFWKGIIQDLFGDFIRFFFTDLIETFDLTKECQFLDKEMEQICPAAEVRAPKFIDKLIKVFIRTGPEDYLMLHTEVQDQKVRGFEERMFTYYYRILDRHKHPVAAIVILTGTNSQFNPGKYRACCLDTTLNYNYRVYRISEQQEEALLKDSNPFAFVILTVLLAQQFQKQQRKNRNRGYNKQIDEELFTGKLRLAEHLLDRNLPLPKQQKLFNFLKHYTPFKTTEYTNLFDNKILLLTNKSDNMYDNMGIEEIIIAQAENRGIKKGEKKAKSTFIQSLLDQTDFPIAKIAMIAGVKEAQVQRLKRSAKCA